MRAIACAGAGPSLVIVHGGTGDRSRWPPLFPLLAPTFRVCAMARRAHGASGDLLPYSPQKEVENVVAVVAAQPGPVFVLTVVKIKSWDIRVSKRQSCELLARHLSILDQGEPAPPMAPVFIFPPGTHVNVYG